MIYKIKATKTVTVAEMDVTIESEFEKGQVPTTLSVNGHKQSEEGEYSNFSSEYDPVRKRFTGFSASNFVPALFAELPTELDAYYTEVKAYK